MRHTSLILSALLTLSSIAAASADGLVLAAPGGPNTQGLCFAAGSSGLRVPCVLEGQTWTRVQRPTDPVDSATVSGRLLSSFISGLGNITTLSPDFLNLGKCNFGLWTGIAPNSGNEPILGCYGVGASTGDKPIVYPAITGVLTDFGIGDNRSNGFANLLVQWRTRYDHTRTEAGIAVNGLSDTGAPPSGAAANFAGKVDFLATHSKRDSSGPAWNFNGNMIMRQGGNGRTPAYNVEWDMSNFDRPYPGVSFQEFFTYQSVYPITASVAFDAETLKDKFRQDTWALTAGSKTITLVSGDINEWYSTQPVEAAQAPGLIPPWTQIATVDTSSNTATLTNAPTQSGNYQLQGRATGAKYGILFNSKWLYNDTTIFDGSNTPTSIQIAGIHKIGISIGANVDWPFLGNGRPICLSGYSSCLQAGPSSINVLDNLRMIAGRVLCLGDQAGCMNYQGNNIVTLSKIQANSGVQMAFGSGLQYSAVAVSALPACNTSNTGLTGAVNDANSPAVGAIVSGGGTSFALVVCDGGSNRVVFKAS